MAVDHVCWKNDACAGGQNVHQSSQIIPPFSPDLHPVLQSAISLDWLVNTFLVFHPEVAAGNFSTGEVSARTASRSPLHA